MSKRTKEKAWFNPMSELDCEDETPKKIKRTENTRKKDDSIKEKVPDTIQKPSQTFLNINDRNWMKNFDPITIEDLAVNNKKVQEIEQWVQTALNGNDMLLLTGPVGSGKTATIQKIAEKYSIKVTEWITPLDIDIPNEHGDYEYKERQSKMFLDFLIKAANFTSLLDGNAKKLVLVEDFPHTFIRTPAEFPEVLQQYKQRARSPIVFICSDSNLDNRNTAGNLFTPSLKEQFQIHHVAINAAAATSLKSALKRVADIISKKYTSMYNVPSPELIDCVVNSSAGDVRSAVLNLHFASLKGSTRTLDTSFVKEKENKSKAKTRKKASSKFVSIGKDETVSILHGVGRVLNPKVIIENNKPQFTHSPSDLIEQFVSQPNSFLNFLEENYLPHFASIDHADKAASALSYADVMVSEWRERVCQEYGVYVATAGLMTANETPVSAWNPVRGPKSMKIQYPLPSEFPMLESNFLYKGKVLVSDYKTFCNIINKG